MHKSNVEYIKTILVNHNFNFNEVKRKSGLTNTSLINHLLELIDDEIFTRTNPFHLKKLSITPATVKQIEEFLINANKKVDDKSIYIKDRELVTNVIDMVAKTCLIVLENKKMLKEEIIASEPIPQAIVEVTEIKMAEDGLDHSQFKLFVEEFVFNNKDIVLFNKIIVNCPSEYKEYFSELTNVVELLDKLTDEIKKENSNIEILGIIRMLAYMFSSKLLSETTKKSIYLVVSTYFSRLKSAKVNGGFKSELKKYFKMLTASINHYDSNLAVDEAFIEKKFGVSKQFSFQTLEEIKSMKAISSRLYDMTSKNAFTMDKTIIGSMEDAISIEKLKNGNTLLTIYIIDPFSYIAENSSLVSDARDRTKNIYTNTGIITMFPEEIAYHDLSLLTDANKKVIAHSFEFSPSMDLVASPSKPAVIRVKNNIKFSEFDGGISPLSSFEVEFLLKLTDILKTEYSSAGSYYANKNEYNQLLGNTHKGINLTSKSEEIINYLKIFSNHMITKKYDETKYPFIYLVSNGGHDLTDLLQFSNNEAMTGITAPFIVEYSTQNKGHRDMGVTPYARTTTPVRNYAALRNQELFKKNIIFEKTYTDQELYVLENDLKEACKHMNEKQRLIDDFLYEAFGNVKRLKKVDNR